MKKVYGIIITLLIVFSFSSIENFALGQESTTHLTNASVVGYIPLIEDGYIVITNNDYMELWNSSTGTGIRSDSYIEEAASERLLIYAYITDEDGFYFYEVASHTVQAILRDISYYHGTTLSYVGMVDSDTALFTGEITIDNSMLQDIAKVNITCYDRLDYVPASNNDTEIFSPLYVNPITSSSFSPNEVNWTGLYKGTMQQGSDDNPYDHTFSATCLGQTVKVGYNLSIRGGDLGNYNESYFIPIGNMYCSFDGSEYYSLSYSYIQLNTIKIIANNNKNLDFYLSVPVDTPSGSYSGYIDLQIEPEE